MQRACCTRTGRRAWTWPDSARDQQRGVAGLVSSGIGIGIGPASSILKP